MADRMVVRLRYCARPLVLSVVDRQRLNSHSRGADRPRDISHFSVGISSNLGTRISPTQAGARWAPPACRHRHRRRARRLRGRARGPPRRAWRAGVGNRRATGPMAASRSASARPQRRHDPAVRDPGDDDRHVDGDLAWDIIEDAGKSRRRSSAVIERRPIACGYATTKYLRWQGCQWYRRSPRRPWPTPCSTTRRPRGALPDVVVCKRNIVAAVDHEAHRRCCAMTTQPRATVSPTKRPIRQVEITSGTTGRDASPHDLGDCT